MSHVVSRTAPVVTGRLKEAVASVQRALLGRYVLPAGLRSAVATAVRGRPADAFLCSFPRSGRTWIAFCLANYLHEFYAVGPEVSFATHLEYVPVADPASDEVPGIESFGFAGRPDIPFIARSHLPWRKGRYPAPQILILRDPHDVLVSFYHYQTGYRDYLSGSFLDYLHGRTEARPSYSLSRYLDSWVSPVLADGVKVTTYEDWLDSPQTKLAELLCFLNVPVDWETVAVACDRGHVANMRRHSTTHEPYLREGLTPAAELRTGTQEAQTDFVRQAVAGGWRSELSETEQGELCRLIAKDITPRTWAMFDQLGVGYTAAH